MRTERLTDGGACVLFVFLIKRDARKAKIKRLPAFACPAGQRSRTIALTAAIVCPRKFGEGYLVLTAMGLNHFDFGLGEAPGPDQTSEARDAIKLGGEPWWVAVLPKTNEDTVCC